MFSSVLVANRGEIAVRIVRTLRRMGIRAVVVASIPDRTSLAVRNADAWVLLEGYSATETYLDMDAIIAAAKSQGCDAIHPGYGFLSERAEFAERCAAEGLVFVGPTPDVLRTMGDKASARQVAITHGVPVVPGWDGADDDAALAREAARVGFPVMLKARGGGGGRGMRTVIGPGDLAEAIGSARREALAAFGDAGLLLERLVTGAHHVEVQVFADSHGNVIHLGERDCSVQRRHQKLVEETPSPIVDATLRRALTGAATRLARAIGYVNAGTFEFLIGEPGESGARPLYFLEVNPRLQVEHPVTEMVTGLDLVELQLRVAAGERLPLQQNEVEFRGHAFEFRINAEDARESFMPSTGRIRSMERDGTRFDSGFEEGDSVPPQYDSLIAKAVVQGADRATALSAARRALANCAVHGVKTNLALHRAIVEAGTFQRGEATIDWLEPALEGLLAGRTVPGEAWVAAAAALGAGQIAQGSAPFQSPGWLGAGEFATWLSDGEETCLVQVRIDASGSGTAAIGDSPDEPFHVSAQVGEQAQFSVRVETPPGRELLVGLDEDPRGNLRVRDAGLNESAAWTFRVVPPPVLPRRLHAAQDGVTEVAAPLSGTIATIRAAVGDEVELGQVLATLEAMKMEHRISAPAAGRVTAVRVAVREVVKEGDILFEVE